MNVAAIDEKGEPIDAANAIALQGNRSPRARRSSSPRSIVRARRPSSTLRFNPQWAAPKPPAPTPRPASATGASGATAAAPAPRPTPYGRGTLYAAPVANAPSQAPADGKTGYIPGATSPDNQPKPPNR